MFARTAPAIPPALLQHGQKIDRLLARAVQLFDQNRPEQAIVPLDQYLSLRPQHYDAVHLRAELALQIKDFDNAIKRFMTAISLKPLDWRAYYNLGLTLQEYRRYGEALRVYDMALELSPTTCSVLNNRGVVLRDLQRYGDAEESFQRTLALDPTFLNAYVNLACIHVRRHQLAQGLTECDRALAINPHFTDAWYNRGFILGESLRFDEAEASYQQVLAREPAHRKAQFAVALCHLVRGRFAQGWQAYETRWLETSLGINKMPLTSPEWDGLAPLGGQRILVYFEQGLGDTLQFCRFVPRLADLGAEVWLIVQPALKRLLESLDPRVTVVDGGKMPEMDYNAPLLSLPRLLQLHEEAQFGGHAYLTPPTDALAHWQTRLGPRLRPRIGLTWSGNAKHSNDHERSLALAELLAVLPTGADYVVVQKDIRDEDAALLARQDSHRILQWPKQDFADTAALCASLDLVISVDTSVAHLAGAVGCPLWVLLPHNPDWRWLLGRDDSPWYAGARLWRQPAHGDWQRPLQALAQALLQAYPELQPAVLPTGH